jgi:hypothetical protein
LAARLVAKHFAFVIAITLFGGEPFLPLLLGGFQRLRGVGPGGISFLAKSVALGPDTFGVLCRPALLLLGGGAGLLVVEARRFQIFAESHTLGSQGLMLLFELAACCISAS